jgi:DNA-binding XRE family transcriptional regulator
MKHLAGYGGIQARRSALPQLLGPALGMPANPLAASLVLAGFLPRGHRRQRSACPATRNRLRWQTSRCQPFLAEFYPDPADKAAIAAGMKQLRAEQRAFRLAEMRRRLGITQAQVAARMGITQGRVSVIEHAKPGTTELRTLAAYVEALGGR